VLRAGALTRVWLLLALHLADHVGPGQVALGLGLVDGGVELVGAGVCQPVMGAEGRLRNPAGSVGRAYEFAALIS
jgi:hypothetical protein